MLQSMFVKSVACLGKARRIDFVEIKLLTYFISTLADHSREQAP